MATKSRQRLDQARRARDTHATVNLDYSTAVDLNNGRNYETVPAQCRMILHGDGARPPCNGNGRLQRHARQRAGAMHAPQWRTPGETRRTSKRPSMTNAKVRGTEAYRRQYFLAMWLIHKNISVSHSYTTGAGAARRTGRSIALMNWRWQTMCNGELGLDDLMEWTRGQ